MFLTMWLLCVIIHLGGCTAHSPAMHHTATAAVVTFDSTQQLPNAVVREGQGGYQRTTVPTGFLVLMLAVPLVILLL